MKKLLFFAVIMALVSCNQGKKNAAETETVVNDSIPATSFVTPHAGRVDLSPICDEAYVLEHMAKYPERYAAAWEFLQNNNLDTIADGTYELMPDREVYVAVSTYVPKDSDQCKYESHLQYIDLQYIATGREGMGVTRDTTLEVLDPFAEGKDYATYAPEGSDAAYETADSSRYYLFYPADIHRPCIRVDGSTEPVHKVVVKIRY